MAPTSLKNLYLGLSLIILLNLQTSLICGYSFNSYLGQRALQQQQITGIIRSKAAGPIQNQVYYNADISKSSYESNPISTSSIYQGQPHSSVYQKSPYFANVVNFQPTPFNHHHNHNGFKFNGVYYTSSGNSNDNIDPNNNAVLYNQQIANAPIVTNFNNAVANNVAYNADAGGKQKIQQQSIPITDFNANIQNLNNQNLVQQFNNAYNRNQISNNQFPYNQLPNNPYSQNYHFHPAIAQNQIPTQGVAQNTPLFKNPNQSDAQHPGLFRYPINNQGILQNPQINQQIPQNRLNNQGILQNPQINQQIPQNPLNNQGILQNPQINPQIPQSPLNNQGILQNPQIPQSPLNNQGILQNPQINPQIPQNPPNNQGILQNPQIPQSPLNNQGILQNPQINQQIPQNPIINEGNIQNQGITQPILKYSIPSAHSQQKALENQGTQLGDYGITNSGQVSKQTPSLDKVSVPPGIQSEIPLVPNDLILPHPAYEPIYNNSVLQTPPVNVIKPGAILGQTREITTQNIPLQTLSSQEISDAEYYSKTEPQRFPPLMDRGDIDNEEFRRRGLSTGRGDPVELQTIVPNPELPPGCAYNAAGTGLNGENCIEIKK